MNASKMFIFLSAITSLAVSMWLAPVFADPADLYGYGLRVTARIALVFFMLAYVLFWTMAATSNNFSMRVLGPSWARLHTFGMHYIWFIFAQSWVGSAIDVPWYGLFVMVSLGGLGLRVRASINQRSPGRFVGA